MKKIYDKYSKNIAKKPLSNYKPFLNSSLGKQNSFGAIIILHE